MFKVDKDDLKLSNTNAEVVVNGVMRGNKRYATMRSSESEWLSVSAGLAWSRSNYIDSGIVHEIEDTENNDFDFQTAKAGYAWQYIQFGVDNALVVIKPNHAHDVISSTSGTSVFQSPAMKELAKVNEKFFEDTDIDKQNGKQIELKFGQMTDEIDEIMQNAKENNIIFSKFFVVTYTVDNNKNIDEIHMFMPNPYSEKFELVENLTGYIDRNDMAYLLTDQEVQSLDNEPEIMNPNYFEIAAAELETQQPSD